MSTNGPTSPSAYRRWVNSNSPTIPNLVDSYVHASDEARDDISTLVGGIVQMYTAQWVWRRTVRKIGPVLLRIRDGEQISPSDARLLLTTLTLSVYLAARNAQAGWRSAARAIEAGETIGKRLSDKLTTKEQSK